MEDIPELGIKVGNDVEFRRKMNSMMVLKA